MTWHQQRLDSFHINIKNNNYRLPLLTQKSNNNRYKFQTTNYNNHNSSVNTKVDGEDILLVVTQYHHTWNVMTVVMAECAMTPYTTTTSSDYVNEYGNNYSHINNNILYLVDVCSVTVNIVVAIRLGSISKLIFLKKVRKQGFQRKLRRWWWCKAMKELELKMYCEHLFRIIQHNRWVISIFLFCLYWCNIFFVMLFNGINQLFITVFEFQKCLTAISFVFHHCWERSTCCFNHSINTSTILDSWFSSRSIEVTHRITVHIQKLQKWYQNVSF